MARTDTLSALISDHDRKLSYIEQLLGELEALTLAIEADPDYAAEMSAGEKTVIDDNQLAITAAVGAMLPVIP